MREKVNGFVGVMAVAILCMVSGLCMVWGIAPVVLAVYVAACAVCGRYMITCIGCATGVAAGSMGIAGLLHAYEYMIPGPAYSGVMVTEKYLVLLGLAMCLMKIVYSRNSRSYVRVIVVMSAAVLMGNIVVYADNMLMAAAYGVVEAAIFMCASVILKPGIGLLYTYICGDASDVERDESWNISQGIVSLMALAAVVLWVVPGEDIYGVNPAFMLALVLILYAVYRTGAVYGCGMAAVAGSIVSVKLNDSRWLMWMLLVTLVMLIGRALTGRRKVSASLFYVLGCVLASVADGTVLWNGSGREIAFYYINIAVPVVLFACIPGALLGAMDEETDPACLQAAAAEINRLTACKIEDMANVFRRLDYTFAGSDEPAISLGQIGELVDGFRRQIDLIGEAREISDEKLLGQIRSLGMDEVRVTASMDSGNRSRYYVAGRTSGQGMVLSRQVADVLSGYFRKNIRAGMDSPSLFFDEYRSAVYEEAARYKGRYHVRRIKKYGSPVSGDNFSVKEYEDGRLVMMLSDGMGSGSLASCESCMMLDTMEELLEAGFAPEYSIAFANRCMSRRNKGRIFTTFDMVVIDMYDGTMRSFKQGASVTYVIRPGDDGNEVSQITSTTLPVGVLDDAECDMADVKLAAGDAVVMVSDGLSDMDVSNHMQDVLKGIRVGDSRRMVDDILGAMIGQGDVSLRDDVTVMAAVISGSEKSSAA